MTKKWFVIIGILCFITLTIIYFSKQTTGVYYKSYSPDGQYSRYASVYKYFNYTIPFEKIADKPGRIYVFDEIENELVGSTSIAMISEIEDTEWNEKSLSARGGFSITLPRKINTDALREYQKSTFIYNPLFGYYNVSLTEHIKLTSFKINLVEFKDEIN